MCVKGLEQGFCDPGMVTVNAKDQPAQVRKAEFASFEALCALPTSKSHVGSELEDAACACFQRHCALAKAPQSLEAERLSVQGASERCGCTSSGASIAIAHSIRELTAWML